MEQPLDLDAQLGELGQGIESFLTIHKQNQWLPLLKHIRLPLQEA